MRSEKAIQFNGLMSPGWFNSPAGPKPRKDRGAQGNEKQERQT